ncbi:MAG TPA: ACT domain-containing protein [bacterium]|nr:ACT domain-containing protein [bacterium]
MEVRQLTIFMDNRPGRLKSVTKVLADANINMRALSIADSTDFGLLRIIVDDPDFTKKTLEDAGFVAKINHVVVIEVDDRPGGLDAILAPIADADINIEYIYAFAGGENKEKALVLFKFNDNQKAIGVLETAKVRILSEEDIKAI